MENVREKPTQIRRSPGNIGCLVLLLSMALLDLLADSSTSWEVTFQPKHKGQSVMPPSRSGLQVDQNYLEVLALAGRYVRNKQQKQERLRQSRDRGRVVMQQKIPFQIPEE
jgi:hypothetical protein